MKFLIKIRSVKPYISRNPSYRIRKWEDLSRDSKRAKEFAQNRQNRPIHRKTPATFATILARTRPLVRSNLYLASLHYTVESKEKDPEGTGTFLHDSSQL